MSEQVLHCPHCGKYFYPDGTELKKNSVTIDEMVIPVPPEDYNDHICKECIDLAKEQLRHARAMMLQYKPDTDQWMQWHHWKELQIEVLKEAAGMGIDVNVDLCQ